MIDMGKYRKHVDDGATPEQIVHLVRTDGLPISKQLGIVKQLFGLSVKETKQVFAQADGETLEERQGRIADALERYLENTDELDNDD